MSEQGWRELLAAEGVDDGVVLHGGAAAVLVAWPDGSVPPLAG